MSASGANSSSSSNLWVPTSCEFNPSSPTLICRVGKNTTKRKAKAKLDEKAFDSTKFVAMQEASKSRVAAMAELIRVMDEETLKLNELRLKRKKSELENKKLELECIELKLQRKELKIRSKELQMLFKNTSKMRQLEDYEIICNMIRLKHGIF